MLKRNKLQIIAIIVASTLFTTVTVEASGGYWIRAYDVGLAYHDSWWVPHYGAFFSGSFGSNQYFTGVTGQPSGYSSWNWWSNNQDVLLLEKRWLNREECIYDDSPRQVKCRDRWDGNSHHAYMAYH